MGFPTISMDLAKHFHFIIAEWVTANMDRQLEERLYSTTLNGFLETMMSYWANKLVGYWSQPLRINNSVKTGPPLAPPSAMFGQLSQLLSQELSHWYSPVKPALVITSRITELAWKRKPRSLVSSIVYVRWASVPATSAQTWAFSRAARLSIMTSVRGLCDTDSRISRSLSKSLRDQFNLQVSSCCQKIFSACSVDVLFHCHLNQYPYLNSALYH